MTVDVEIQNRIVKCQKILETDPNSQIFAALAEAFRKKGELERAFQVCHGGLRIHPEYGPAHVVMAKINLDRGLYDWAEAEVEKAREVEGDTRTIELLLAEIHLYKGNYQSAIKLLRRLSAHDPQNEHVRKLLDIAVRIPQEQETRLGAPVASGVTPTEAAAPPPSELPLRGKPTPLTPPELLSEALRIPGTSGVMYINSEGLVMESQWRSEMDPSVCGAALAEVSKFLDQELMKVSFGRVGTVLIETARQVFYLLRVRNGMFLVASGSEVNLGTLRMKMDGLLERVRIN
jgi:predicted regulator of Ras-like GTPase activity (Roadblock/LC7/MglB family)